MHGVHELTDEPAEAEKRPVLQELQTDAPEPMVYCPLPQAVQRLNATVAVILPASQDVHAVALEESEY